MTKHNKVTKDIYAFHLHAPFPVLEANDDQNQINDGCCGENNDDDINVYAHLVPC